MASRFSPFNPRLRTRRKAHCLRVRKAGYSNPRSIADPTYDQRYCANTFPQHYGCYLQPRRVQKPGRINFRVLGTLLAVVILVGISAVAVRYVRKRVVARQELQAGLAAYERRQWPEAAAHLKEYLRRRPTDQTENRHIEIPEKYAHALLQIRPLEPDHIGAAISAYRRVLRYDPSRTQVYAALADLYIDLRDLEELTYIARKRRELVPDDPKAAIWLATAQIGQRKLAEARQELIPVVEDWDAARANSEDYVLACVMLSGITTQQRSPQAWQQALDWLDRAVAQAPQSAMARIQRARFQRSGAASAARHDLEAAGKLESVTPQERLTICREWMELGDLERGLAEMTTLEQLDQAELERAFVSMEEWHTRPVPVESRTASAVRRSSEGGGAGRRTVLGPGA